jgi:hypothetical protein
MAAGTTTVQNILDALAEQVATIPEIKKSVAGPVLSLQKDILPAVIFTWFSDIDTVITTGSDQKWNPACKAILYYSPIVGNELAPPIAELNDLIHKLVDKINVHPHQYPYGSAMAALSGVDRINVTRIRTSEFGLNYAGSRYTGAELFLDIKLHRKINY